MLIGCNKSAYFHVEEHVEYRKDKDEEWAFQSKALQLGFYMPT
jgi:hypothetical protein